MRLCLDGNFTDRERRAALFQGDLLLYSKRPAMSALCCHAGAMIEEVFGEDPERAQFEMDVETFVAKAGPLKSRFTNDLSTKLLVRAVLEEHGCDLSTTYFDVPRLRVVTSDGYLSAGV